MAEGQARIEQLYAYIALDPADNTEGVVSFTHPTTGAEMPLVGADMDRATSWWPIAERIAAGSGVEIRLVHFTNRVEVDTIRPRGASRG